MIEYNCLYCGKLVPIGNLLQHVTHHFNDDNLTTWKHGVWRPTTVEEIIEKPFDYGLVPTNKKGPEGPN